MNEEIKRKADELVEQFVQELIDNSNWDAITSDGVKCAILSTKNTIETLDKMVSNEYSDFEIYNEQNEILKELESRI